MRYQSRTHRAGVHLLLMAGAFVFGGCGSFLHAQEASPRAKGTAPAGIDTPGPTPQFRLRAQQLATRKAGAAYEIAKATHELAEIAVEEYAWSSYPRDLAAVEGEIKLAESDLSRSEDRVGWARRMFDKGYVSKATKLSEELSLKKAQFALEQARTRRKVMVEYTKAKRVKGLQSAAEKARADELAKLATWERERAKQADLERQLPQPQPGAGDERPAANEIPQKGGRFQQRKSTLRAETAFRDARLKRELAEIDVAEYVEVGFPQELATIEVDLRRAQSSLEACREQARVAIEKGWRNPLATDHPISAKLLAIKKAEFQVEQAESRRKVLVQYTKFKTLKELVSEVQKARSDELAKEAAWELEKAKESKRKRQDARPRIVVDSTRI